MPIPGVLASMAVKRLRATRRCPSCAAKGPAAAVSRAATSTTIEGWRVLTATIRPISGVSVDKKRLEKGYDRAERWLGHAPDLSSLAFGGDTVNGQEQIGGFE